MERGKLEMVLGTGLVVSKHNSSAWIEPIGGSLLIN